MERSTRRPRPSAEATNASDAAKSDSPEPTSHARSSAATAHEQHARSPGIRRVRSMPGIAVGLLVNGGASESPLWMAPHLLIHPERVYLLLLRDRRDIIPRIARRRRWSALRMLVATGKMLLGHIRRGCRGHLLVVLGNVIMQSVKRILLPSGSSLKKSPPRRYNR